MKHLVTIIALLAGFGGGYLAHRPPAPAVQPVQTIDGMDLQHYAVAVRLAEKTEFITRNPAAGQVLDCGKYYSHKTHQWGFYNCDWTDPKHASGPAQFRP